MGCLDMGMWIDDLEDRHRGTSWIGVVECCPGKDLSSKQIDEDQMLLVIVVAYMILGLGIQ